MIHAIGGMAQALGIRGLGFLDLGLALDIGAQDLGLADFGGFNFHSVLIQKLYSPSYEGLFHFTYPSSFLLHPIQKGGMIRK
ncbi:MAG: hypothetical protein ACE3JN_14320 [Ectobacillus sp.]